jgi:hypothetical protein
MDRELPKTSIAEIAKRLQRLKLPAHVIERHVAQLKKARVVERKREYVFSSASTGGTPGTQGCDADRQGTKENGPAETSDFLDGSMGQLG